MVICVIFGLCYNVVDIVDNELSLYCLLPHLSRLNMPKVFDKFSFYVKFEPKNTSHVTGKINSRATTNNMPMVQAQISIGRMTCITWRCNEIIISAVKT